MKDFRLTELSIGARRGSYPHVPSSRPSGTLRCLKIPRIHHWPGQQLVERLDFPQHRWHRCWERRSCRLVQPLPESVTVSSQVLQLASWLVVADGGRSWALERLGPARGPADARAIPDPAPFSLNTYARCCRRGYHSDDVDMFLRDNCGTEGSGCPPPLLGEAESLLPEGVPSHLLPSPAPALCVSDFLPATSSQRN